MSVTIVKIGGSLFGSPQCRAWLSLLAEPEGGIVVVPGGGPFAEAVRAAQAASGFDDTAAHRMALLAMEQFAILLASHSPKFALAGCRADMDKASSLGQVPIWLPSAMVLAAPDVPASWDVTSDSLAAWLAGTLHAHRLLLVKSCDETAPVSACELVEKKIVDPFFPGFAERSGAEVWIAGPAALAGARGVLRDGGMPGMPVTAGTPRCRGNNS